MDSENLCPAAGIYGYVTGEMTDCSHPQHVPFINTGRASAITLTSDKIAAACAKPVCNSTLIKLSSPLRLERRDYFQTET